MPCLQGREARLDYPRYRLEIEMLHGGEQRGMPRVLRASLHIRFDLFGRLASHLKLRFSELRENLLLHFLMKIEREERAGHQCSDNQDDDERVPSHERLEIRTWRRGDFAWTRARIRKKRQRHRRSHSLDDGLACVRSQSNPDCSAVSRPAIRDEPDLERPIYARGATPSALTPARRTDRRRIERHRPFRPPSGWPIRSASTRPAHVRPRHVPARTDRRAT